MLAELMKIEIRPPSVRATNVRRPRRKKPLYLMGGSRKKN